MQRIRYRAVSTITTIFGILAVSAIVGPPAAAQTTITLGGSAVPEHGTNLHLVQRADRLIPRTRAQVDMRIEAANDDPKQLQAQVASTLAKALDRLKSVKETTAETGAYVVIHQTAPFNPRNVPNPMTSANGASPSMTVSNAGEWRATQLLSIVSHDPAALASLISDLQSAGLQLAEMRFTLDPDAMRTAQNELAADALTGLRAQAQKLAAVMDMSIERMTTIDVNNSPPENIPQPQIRPAINPNQVVQPTIVQSGDANVWVTVSANLQMMPKDQPPKP